jgi:tRNA pseudouridine55 synthase
MIRLSTERRLRSSSASSMTAKGPIHVAGLLIVDKPGGCTSHDVVAQIRRWTRVPRVGHAGTLDPQATGVLLIGLGAGTKLTPFLQECRKTYRATLQLGQRTDTLDAAGNVVEVRPVREMSRADVEAVLAGFRGVIEQIPPMFSALKRRGQRLYTLARQGVDVERQPRRVQIFRLVLVDFTAATLRLEVECASGTYIRALADDIGTRLGCGAHLSALVRTAIGPFTLAHALPLPALEDAVHRGDWLRHVRALSTAVAAFPALILTAAAAQRLAHGVAPTPPGIVRHVGAFEAADTVALLGPDEALRAMGSAVCRAAELRDMPQSAPVVKLRRVLS